MIICKGFAQTGSMLCRKTLQFCMQDRFISTITKIKEKSNSFKTHKKRGWYTKEAMKTKLQWSKYFIKTWFDSSVHVYTLLTDFSVCNLILNGVIQTCEKIGSCYISILFWGDDMQTPRSYIDSAVKFCEKKGNEALVKLPDCKYRVCMYTPNLPSRSKVYRRSNQTSHSIVFHQICSWNEKWGEIPTTQSSSNIWSKLTMMMKKFTKIWRR